MNRIAVHVVGASDLGMHEPTLAETATRITELTGLEPSALADELAGTPIDWFLRKIKKLDDHPVDKLILIATKQHDDPRVQPATQDLAEVILPFVRQRVPATTVEQIPLPSIADARHGLETFVDNAANAIGKETQWELPLGGGATGVLLGVMFELLLRGHDLTLWAANGVGRRISLVPRGLNTAPARWLVRHRYYEPLASSDPPLEVPPTLSPGDEHWQKLAQRQRVDVSALLADQLKENGAWKVTDAVQAILAEAVQAAFAEGLARGEITDGATARTWLSLAKHAAIPENKQLVRPLLDPKDPKIKEWRKDIVRLSHGMHKPVPTHPVIRTMQNEWATTRRAKDRVLQEFPDWPVAPPPLTERTVVVLRALSRSTTPDQGEIDDQFLLDRIFEALGAGQVLSFEFVTGMARVTATREGVERIPVTVIDPKLRPDNVEQCRDQLVGALLADPRAVVADEVAVLLPIGRKALVVAAILAGIEWSLHAAVPLTLLVAEGDHGPDGPVIETTRITAEKTRPFAVLGLDSALAHLAAEALTRLDITLAGHLLERGSRTLQALAVEVVNLQCKAFGVPPSSTDDQTSAAEVAFARARLGLCRQIVDSNPWDAVFLAIAMLEHTFRMPSDTKNATVHELGEFVLIPNEEWVPAESNTMSPIMPEPDTWYYLAPWTAVRSGQGACRELNKWRNRHPLSHGFVDKATQDEKTRPIRVPEPADVATLLDKADAELTKALADRYPSLILEDRDALIMELVRLRDEVLKFAKVPKPIGQSGAAAE
ncbi:hypothetical protein [Frankia sp. Cr2]|uniref:hypothetical protein n=1 Tax=Frankia sp. Cr2 TaxID=3073932 RepID=UPI002AD302A9|nr:hypothetical protein [Frankia sp. Cr2]